MKTIEFSNLHQSYRKGFPVLDGLSFSVAAGEVVGLVGRNGAGKTTLIRLTMGMLAPQAGSVKIFGVDPRRDPLGVKRRVGYVAEDQILPDFLKVREILRLHRQLFATWDGNLQQKLLDQFEIPLDAKIKTLSKGQARQVALLCAIAHRPEILLLDEPAGGLDPAVRREFLETSIHYLNETGSTILFSSHYMGDIERLAGRIVLLHSGKALLDRQLDELREEFSLALLPIDTRASRAELLDLQTCVAVRKRSDSLHAVFHLDPEATRLLLERRFGVLNVRCQSIPLEEMFIEITGGQR